MGRLGVKGQLTWTGSTVEGSPPLTLSEGEVKDPGSMVGDVDL